MTATTYDSQSALRDARKTYFDDNGFGTDGGYSAKWVTVKFGPIPITFPNTEQRIRSVGLHDLHHVATGYQTDLRGEAEFGAGEVGGSCRDHYAAWVLNLLAMSYGWWMCPRRMFRAFVHGRHTKNLYTRDYGDDLLDQSVGELRATLELDGSPTDATGADIVAYLWWTGVATGLGLSLLFAGLLPLGILYAVLA